MDISKLSAADFEKIISLLKQKEKLQAQLADVDAALAKVTSGGGARPGRPGRPAKAAAAKAPKAPKAARKVRRGKRGALKQAVLDTIKAAGKNGITAKEIAGKVNKPVMNVYTWFNTTGKGIKNIKKEGDPLRYRWEE